MEENKDDLKRKIFDIQKLRRLTQFNKFMPSFKLQRQDTPSESIASKVSKNSGKTIHENAEEEDAADKKKKKSKRYLDKRKQFRSQLSERLNEGFIYKFSFNEVIFILKKPYEERQESEIDGMMLFFKNNKFFKDLETKNGKDVVRRCLRCLNYEQYEANQYVMHQGDYGFAYYVILEGTVQILQNKEITNEYTCMEIFKTLIDNYEFIINDQNKQEILKELKYYFKNLIHTEVNEVGKEVYSIVEFDKAREFCEITDKVKHFMCTNAYGIKEIIKRKFTYTQLIEITRIEEGGSIGEYALLHKKKRSATVRTLTPTHFATMNREAFEDVMFSIKKKETDIMVQFLSQYDFLKGLTYDTKAKISYNFNRKSYHLGQDVYKEGSAASKIYLIESGQFVITKDLYIRRDQGK